MTPEEVGVYVLLLCNQWADGVLTDDMAALSRLANGADPKTVLAVLERCFEKGPEGWSNGRLKAVKEEQIERRQAKVRAGKASAKSRRRNKIEQRSSGVQTSLERSTNQSESESEQKKKLPTSKLWDIWIDELGGNPPQPRLTAKRRKLLEAVYTEHLSDEDDPLGAFRKILRAVKASDHHMSQRSYQMPESLFRNEERRDRWYTTSRNGTGSSARKAGLPGTSQRMKNGGYYVGG